MGSGRPGPRHQPRSVWGPGCTGALLAIGRMGSGRLMAVGVLVGGPLRIGGWLPDAGPRASVRAASRGLLACCGVRDPGRLPVFRPGIRRPRRFLAVGRIVAVGGVLAPC